MLKNIKVKGMLLVFVLIALLFSTNDFGIVGAEKMGIVSAIGIDKIENEYLVTTQIATAESGDTKSGNQKILSASSKTISNAIGKIQENTGWTMNLNFLNLIVLGESVVDDSIYSALEFFIRGESSLPNVTLAVSENANEVMKARTVLDKISSIALHKNLNSTGDKINSIIKISLKDYFINYFSASKSNYLPFVKIQEEIQDAESQEKNSFFLLSTMVINGNKSVGILNSDKTSMLNIIENKKAHGFLAVDNVQIEEEKYSMDFKITKKKICKSIDINQNGEVEFKLNVDLTLALKDKTKVSFNTNDLIRSRIVTEDALEIAKEKVQNDIESLFDFMKSANTDIFKIKENLQKYHFKKYREFFDENYLQSTKLILNVNCKSSD